MWKTRKKWPWCPGKCPGKMRNFRSICRMYTHSLFSISTQQIMWVHPTGAPEIPHFSQVIYTDTRVFFSGFPHIPETCTAFLSVCGMFIQDIYPPIYLCTSCRCSGNSAFVPRHLPGRQGCVFRVFRIFSETITWTPGLFFSGFPHIAVVFFAGFPHIPGICTAFLHVCDIFIQDIYPLNY